MHLVGRLTGYTPRWFSYFIGDAHIYENHMDMVQEQLKREPVPAPKLEVSDRAPSFAETRKYQPEWLELVEPSEFSLEGYQHHAPHHRRDGSLANDTTPSDHQRHNDDVSISI
jgi:thymidylate synthase